jgi:hypothetical protein
VLCIGRLARRVRRMKILVVGASVSIQDSMGQGGGSAVLDISRIEIRRTQIHLDP